MAKDVYQKLSDLTLLRRSWHLARSDSRADFIHDPFRHSDFAFRLDDYLKAIAAGLAQGTYHPSPLLTVDVPKSSLSVRPGSIISIEDRIVLFAITLLIAPALDRKLPDSVYSWRLRKDRRDSDLFKDHELLRFPFLKRKTIARELDIVEPWYGVWPQFIEDIEYAYEQEGYEFLVLSDIVSYFENIDLSLLRDLLKYHLPTQLRVVNFLVDLLEYWTWPALHHTSAPRGIPQGNAVSSFIGNIYLLPLDLEFAKLARRADIKYFRYMDDVKVLAKDVRTAREALFLMNGQLRSLRLNIQGAKTQILQGVGIKGELFDDRLDRVNDVIEKIQKKKSLSVGARQTYVSELRAEARKVKGKQAIVRGRELRLFRRLITAFTLLRHGGLARTVIDQLSRNPDARLLSSAIKYLRTQGSNTRIVRAVANILSSGDSLFPYERAQLFMLSRQLHEIPPSVVREARRELGLRGRHWCVRQEAALLLGSRCLNKIELGGLRRKFLREEDVQVKRALVFALVQMRTEDVRELTRNLVFSVHPKLQQTGRLLHGLLFEADDARVQCSAVFRDRNEGIIFDRFLEIEVLARSNDSNVRALLRSKLRAALKYVRSPVTLQRIRRLLAATQMRSG